MTINKLIERVEGEAQLAIRMDEGVVADVDIGFGIYRGIETILRGKPPQDALVITPRTCGICNHAHLMAAVAALEDALGGEDEAVYLTSKAKTIRELTLWMELIQNHIKWFYLTVLPRLEEIGGEENSARELALKASYATQLLTRSIAVFAGQWPHASYAVPGGVTCDPTHLDRTRVLTWIEEAIRFWEQVVLGIPIERYLALEQARELETLTGDLGRALMLLGRAGFARKGRSYDRFLVLGKDKLFRQGKATPTTVTGIQMRYVEETKTPDRHANRVLYRQRPYEVGPLARAMVNKVPLIRSLHQRYRDATLVRIAARMDEAARLLVSVRTALKHLCLHEPSWVPVASFERRTAHGVGVIEAARGSLIHTVSIHNGVIDRYEIIVPTQWNLHMGTSNESGVAVRAMQGLGSVEEAALVFYAFDVCSVCTIQ